MFAAGLDIGTTGCKIVVYNEKSECMKVYYEEYSTTHFDGNHEIDFGCIKQAVLDILKKLLKEFRISALGVTSFGETFVMLDENDNILAPSMLYTDPRGSGECEYLSNVIGMKKLTYLTGVKPHPMYSISKILWHKNNNKDLFAKCHKIFLGEDFIVYTLTGNRCIDYTLAARTGAFDIENKIWINEVFDALDIDMNLMSAPVKTGHLAGMLKQCYKDDIGIDYDVAIVNGCHDQIAAMIGAGVFDSTCSMDGTGTVECIPIILDKKPEDIEFYNNGYSAVPFNDKYACYAFSYAGGATLKWFRDNIAYSDYQMCKQQDKNVYAYLDGCVKNEPSGILVLPHFSGAATPYMDTGSKAVFVGITLETDKSDLYKALMEGTAYEMLYNFNVMKEYTEKIENIKATGGGASSDVWLQIKADILGKEITALSCNEVGAAGTTAIAGVSVGIYKDINTAVSGMAPVRKVFIPTPEKHKLYSKLYDKYKMLYSSVRDLM